MTYFNICFVLLPEGKVQSMWSVTVKGTLGALQHVIGLV